MLKHNLVKRGCISLRCIVRKDGDQYVASCLDLCLAAQSDSMAEAARKLHLQIKDYITDELRDGVLFARPAPFSEWVIYYIASATVWLKKIETLFDLPQTGPRVFRDKLPSGKFAGA